MRSQECEVGASGDGHSLGEGEEEAMCSMEKYAELGCPGAKEGSGGHRGTIAARGVQPGLADGCARHVRVCDYLWAI